MLDLKDGIKGYSGVTTLEYLTYIRYRWGGVYVIDITSLQDIMKYLFDITKGLTVNV